MKFKKIAFDMDDTLVLFGQPFIDFHNKNYSTNQIMEDFTSFEFHKHFNIPLEELIKRVNNFYNSDAFLNIPAAPGAKELINLLKQESELMVITSRPNSVMGQTIYQLEKNFDANFSQIIHIGEFQGNEKKKKKADVCLKFGAGCMFDDSYVHVKECAEKGIQTYLMTRPWNAAHDVSAEKYIKRIKNLREIINNFQ